LPQPPQLRASVAVSMHISLQQARPPPHRPSPLQPGVQVAMASLTTRQRVPGMQSSSVRQPTQRWLGLQWGVTPEQRGVQPPASRAIARSGGVSFPPPPPPPPPGAHAETRSAQANGKRMAGSVSTGGA
jgi:hypothetical protein